MVYHERQESALCAQHALNSLLQGSFFSASDLGEIACQLDEEERSRYAEAGLDSRDLLNSFSGSQNCDDSGFFSSMTIERALQVWSLELIPRQSQRAVEAVRQPEQEQGFICNFDSHWLTLRRLSGQWWNLDSTLEQPEPMSDTYLGLYLQQLEQDGLHPPTHQLVLNPALQATPSLWSEARFQQVQGPHNRWIDKQYGMPGWLQYSAPMLKTLEAQALGEMSLLHDLNCG
ncbi:uncharacterized protein MONBRDRAFT_24015 [Monosiga brevicollis MX1]|uniref:ubiquitinyl hydrolase 1 n=1 Tax=Monosiga brevicollis TaxID=81824 RepID=A9UUG1_MONBE|nr:uncharacterized protein MONBRDRAFT_24015 [Monosiga brevicollis MX1]EDQ91092.1 predicted protein [Monosiga brevicollis MX1]|eukprot:XP_001744389.1 hypothetical protein [Monosiga brevicollis MX1]